jgi:hypothetical protein
VRTTLWAPSSRRCQAVGGAVYCSSVTYSPQVTGLPDRLDRAAFALAEADALGDEDRLPKRVGMPRRPCARGEVHAGRAEARRCRARGDHVDVDVAGEPVGRALHGVVAAAGELHGVLFPVRGGWVMFKQ